MGSMAWQDCRAGLLAVLAPGGLVVREGALVVLLTPSIGAQPALLMALAARLWQVALEVMLALVVLGIDTVRRRALARGA